LNTLTSNQLNQDGLELLPTDPTVALSCSSFMMASMCHNTLRLGITSILCLFGLNIIGYLSLQQAIQTGKLIITCNGLVRPKSSFGWIMASLTKQSLIA